MLAAVIGLAALTTPVVADAHCLRFDKVRSEVTGAVDGTASFVRRVADRTVKLGDRMFGWIRCDKHV
jgi:hypothetical protein